MNNTIIVTGLEELINKTGGIPLSVTQTTTTNPWQFYLTLILGGIFTIWVVFNSLKTPIKLIIGKIILKLFIEKNDIKKVMIIKHTSSDLFNSSMIDRKTLSSIQKALIKFDEEPFDLILYTPGGEIFSATYISRMLRKYKGKIRTIVPTFSMSGGTLLALSTDEIYMNDYACLGSIDPQLGNLFKFGSARAWKEIFRIKGKKAEDNTISMKLMGEQYTKSIKNNIKELLKDKVEKKDINKIADYLTNGNIEHGYNLTKDILREIGIDIKDIPRKTNERLVKIMDLLPEGVSWVK